MSFSTHWSSRLTTFLCSSIVIVSFLLLLWPLLATGVPATHDGEGHVARASNYYLAVKQGQLPPRWAPNFWNGFGYSVFNFHYPLLSMLSLPLLILDAHPEIAVKIVLAAAIIALTSSIVAIGRKLSSWSTGLVMAASVLLSPYLFNLLYVRGTYGEVLGYTAVSFWIMSVVYGLSAEKRWRWVWITLSLVSITALSLAHNILAMILIPIFVLSSSYLVLRDRRHWPWLAAVVIAGLVTSFFWIPALLEKSLTLLDDTPVTYSEHFATIPQILFSPVGQGISVAGPKDGLSLSVGALSVITIVIASWLIGWNWWHTRRIAHRPLLALVSVGACVWLATEYSATVWQAIPLLQFVQFPWRFIGVALIPSTALLGWVWCHTPRLLRWLLVLVLITLLLLRFSWPMRERFHFSPEYYLQYTQTTTVWDEMRTRTWQVPVWIMSRNHPVITPDHTATLEEWTGSRHLYSFTATTPVTVVEPTMYFAGWETEVNGQVITYDLTLADGQLAYTLPVGEYRVATRFTQNTPARKLGNSLTILGMLAAIGFIGQQAWQVRANGQKSGFET